MVILLVVFPTKRRGYVTTCEGTVRRLYKAHDGSTWIYLGGAKQRVVVF